MESLKKQVEILSRQDILARDKENLLTWWIGDVLKQIKNINETSFNP